jgi:manganese/zinc/iron transport system ATP- binding protein
MKTALSVKNLTVNYDHTSVLWDINFDIPSGEMVGIIGPNGAGKSTLIQATLGFVKPLSGQIRFFEQPLKKVKKRIAYVPQRKGIDWSFPATVFDVVLMGRYGHLGVLKWYRNSDKETALQLLRLLEMEELKDRHISELSGGQQQRLFIARALMQEADLLFLDEPFAGVDKKTEVLIIEVLKKLKKEGKTVVMVHHDLHTVEAYFDSVVLLRTSVIAAGKTAEVFSLDHLNRAYGSEQGSLFDEVLRLSLSKSTGLQ